MSHNVAAMENQASTCPDITGKQIVCTEQGQFFPDTADGKSESQIAPSSYLQQCRLASEKTFACQDCASSFTTSGFLQKHMVRHTASGGHVFSCDQCTASFTKCRALKQHMMKHANDKNYFPCSKCSLSFKKEGWLQRHLQGAHLATHHVRVLRYGSSSKTESHEASIFSADRAENGVHEKSSLQEFRCQQCEASFSSECSLKKHMVKHKDTGGRVFACSQCPASYPTSKSLKKHMVRHNSDRPYPCDLCSRSFISKGFLAYHQRLHARGERPYLCSFCAASFATKDSLNTHLRTHTGEKPFICTVCGAAHSSRGNLRSHMAMHTTQSTFRCHECGATFKHYRSWTRHKLSHLSMKPYACHQCDASFKDDRRLQIHIQTHTGIKPYTCTECAISYHWPENLKRHMARKHPRESRHSFTQLSRTQQFPQDPSCHAGTSTEGEKVECQNQELSSSRVKTNTLSGTTDAAADENDQLTDTTRYSVSASARDDKQHQTSCEDSPSQLVSLSADRGNCQTTAASHCKLSVNNIVPSDSEVTSLTSVVEDHIKPSAYSNSYYSVLFADKKAKILKSSVDSSYVTSSACSKTHHVSLSAYDKDRHVNSRTYRNLHCVTPSLQISIPYDTPTTYNKVYPVASSTCDKTCHLTSFTDNRHCVMSPTYGKTHETSPVYSNTQPETSPSLQVTLHSQDEKHCVQSPAACTSRVTSSLNDSTFYTTTFGSTHPWAACDSTHFCDNKHFVTGNPTYRNTHDVTVYAQDSQPTVTSDTNHSTNHMTLYTMGVHSHGPRNADSVAHTASDDKPEAITSTDGPATYTDNSAGGTNHRVIRPPASGTSYCMTAFPDSGTNHHVTVLPASGTNLHVIGLPANRTNYHVTALPDSDADRHVTVCPARDINHHIPASVTNGRMAGLAVSGPDRHATVCTASDNGTRHHDIVTCGTDMTHNLTTCTDVGLQPAAPVQDAEDAACCSITKPEFETSLQSEKRLPQMTDEFSRSPPDNDLKKETSCDLDSETEGDSPAPASLSQRGELGACDLDSSCEQNSSSSTEAASVQNYLASPDDSQPFTCPICEMSFKSKGWLQRHIQLHQSRHDPRTGAHISTMKPQTHNVPKSSTVDKDKMISTKQPLSVSESSDSATAGSVKRDRPTTRGLHSKPSTSAGARAKSFTHQPSCRSAAGISCQNRLASANSEPLFPCRQCDASFTSSSSLKKHQAKHRNRGGQVFLCDQCPASYPTSKSLKKHMVRHNSDRPYPCDLCPRSFISKGFLAYHKQLHTRGERPFLCSVCAASFASRDTLNTHARTHSGERPYVCTVCNAAHASRGNLRSHMALHSSEKNLVCQQCGAAFKHYRSFTRHKLGHLTKKPYACNLCHSSFKDARRLRIHLQTHTGEKPHTCVECGISYHWPENLKRHMARKHPGVNNNGSLKPASR